MIAETPEETLRKIVDDARGDNLERLEADFKSRRKVLSDCFGIYDTTWGEELDKRRLQRAQWQAASDLLDRLLATKH